MTFKPEHVSKITLDELRADRDRLREQVRVLREAAIKVHSLYPPGEPDRCVLCAALARTEPQS